MTSLKTWNSRQQLPENWENQIVWLWEEDDARPPDREMARGAFKRIFGRRPKHETVVRTADYGDSGFTLYSSGRVLGWSYEGASVGILVSIED